MHDIETEIRDLINVRRTRDLLMRDTGNWYQLCSSLDVVGDTTLAIAAYVEGGITAKTPEHAVGTSYLLVYGLLQALVVQQDAVTHLYKALDLLFDIKEHPKLDAIRDIRNASIGHPTRKDRPKRDPVSFHFISRYTLNRGGFQLLKSDERGCNEFSMVDIGALIVDQRAVVADLLTAVVAELQRREAEHKAAFRTEKLVDAFSNHLTYAFGKLNDEIRGSGPGGLGIWALDEVQRSMDNLRAALVRRDIAIDDSGPMGYIPDDLAYPLDELRRYLRHEESEIGSERMAEICAFFIQARIDELKSLAREIDEDYAADRG